MNRTLSLLAFAAVTGTLPTSAAEVADGNTLAQRFRPYYKFSLENEGRTLEPHRPIAWESFVSHSNLYQGDTLIAAKSKLAADPARILRVADGDIRTAKNRSAPLRLLPDDTARAGDSWKSVIETGAGLYAQVEDAGNGYVVITYWTLFGRNSIDSTAVKIGAGIAKGLTLGASAWPEHDGDITAVVLLYHRPTDELVRASFVIHGDVLESFDLALPGRVFFPTLLVGTNYRDKSLTTERVRGVMIPDARRIQDGPSGNAFAPIFGGHAWSHSPSAPVVYFAAAPGSNTYEHVVVFHEWGAHEPWPNTGGAVTGAPKHFGDGMSFLPLKVRYLGSVTNPAAENAPFVLFNGLWGDDPKGMIFHRTCYYQNGWRKNDFRIPEDKETFVDRDPYSKGGLHWPPPTLNDSVRVKMTVSCAGTADDARVSIRWGHPNFHDNEYLGDLGVIGLPFFYLGSLTDRAEMRNGWTVYAGTKKTKTFYIPAYERNTEFEIQTEGGDPTGYAIAIEFTRPGGHVSTMRLNHSNGAVRDVDTVDGGIGASRSGALNYYGEQSIRVDLDGNTKGAIR